MSHITESSVSRESLKNILEFTLPVTKSESRGSEQLADAIYRECGQNVNLCYQCGKCAAGCPVSYVLDYTSTQLIHAIRLGMDDLVFNSKTIWLCASCETCTTRCPQEVDIAKVMDAVKIEALRRGAKSAVPQIPAFYKATLGNIRVFGRMYDLGMLLTLKLMTRELFKDMNLGIQMLKKGKLKLLPSFKGSTTAKRIFIRVKKLEKGS
ncbi:MAG: heterodisulfide reductase subunit C [Proteobacteria bacterium]|nr:heterodisulfide reductase subunit C [Pseudomonadota bacterium]